MNILKYIIFPFIFLYSLSGHSIERILDDKWCEGKKIHSFAGGPEGDAFAAIVAAGIENAFKHTGADGKIIYSGWDTNKMLQSVRESISMGVDGISVMGFAGNDAMIPIAKMASDAGVLMNYMVVDVPDVRKTYGGGYVGADLGSQGYALGEKAIRDFDFKAGDKAIVFVLTGDYSRAIREDMTRIAFEDHGMEVVVIDAVTLGVADPNTLIPTISAALAAHPDTKIIVHPGGQQLGNAEAYAKAAGYGPNEIYQIGFDTSAQVMSGFVNGYVHLTADQQPFQEGYLPVFSLCQRLVLGLGPISQDTGVGYVDVSNYGATIDLANAGLR